MDIIFEIAKRNNEYVDIYAEVPFTKGGYFQLTKGGLLGDYQVSNPKEFLSKTISFLWTCFDKTICKYKNVRFHYVDIRQDARSPDVIDGAATPFLFIFNVHQKEIKTKEEQEFLDFIVKNLPTRFIYTYIFSENYEKDSKKLAKELDAKYRKQYGSGNDFLDVFNKILSYRTVKKNGKTFTRVGSQLFMLRTQVRETKGEKRTIMYNMYDKLEEYIQDKTDKYQKFLQYEQNVVVNVLFILDVFIMDIYTLARMFRTFPGTGHVESKIVIEYAGDSHIQNTLEFFRDYLDVNIKTYKQTDKRCTKFKIADLINLNI